MFTEGYVNIHRKIINWEWYDDINVYRLFTHLIFTANWTNATWHGIDLKAGQKITSLEHLADETGLSKQQVRTALNKLKSTGEITSVTTNKYTLITIENYGIYQNNKEENNTQNNKPITNNQQTINKPITNNQQQYNKDNKYNKEKKYNNNNKMSDSCVDGLQDIIDFYNNNIGMITSYGIEVLSDYTKEMSTDLIIFAMQIAVEANKRTIQYIKGILNNWNKKGIKTLEEAKQENKKFKRNNIAEEEFLNDKN